MSVILDEYQKKLEQFIAVVPKHQTATQVNQATGTSYYGEVRSGTPVLQRVPYKTKEEKDAYKKKVEENLKSVKDNPAFTDLSGLTHTKLLNSWKDGGLLTSCNGFVDKAVSAMGGRGLGGFDVEKLLRSMNKSHCWITPASKPKSLPRYGDVFETRVPARPGQGYENLHVGVSLEIRNGEWHTVEGGQGGPGSLGCDRVARVAKAYNERNVLGWVDMKLFLSNAPPLPDWLLGSWYIYSGKQIVYVYKFDRYGGVAQFIFAGHDALPDAESPADMGSLTLFPGDKVEIHWTRKGTTEEFTHDWQNSFPAILERMNGVAADGSPLKAVRL